MCVQQPIAFQNLDPVFVCGAGVDDVTRWTWGVLLTLIPFRDGQRELANQIKFCKARQSS